MDPRQAMFDKIGEQALKTLASADGAEMIARDAKARGPAPAIASALQQTVASVQEAAKTAGVQLPPDVVSEITQSLAKVLVALMVQSGIAEDPEAVMQELAPMLGDQGEQEEPGEMAEGESPEYEAQEEADPSMEAGEPGEEMQPPMRPRGALSAARGM